MIALDNRTRRSYASEIGPPGNVSTEALVDQIPPPPLPAGREVLIVDRAAAGDRARRCSTSSSRPPIYRIFDLVAGRQELRPTRRASGGPRRMPGTNPDAIEAWALRRRSPSSTCWSGWPTTGGSCCCPATCTTPRAR